MGAVTIKRTEKQAQAAVKKLLGTLGVAVWDTSQPRAAMVTPGLPDLLCICPRRGLFFVEVKRAGGKQTPAQREFERRCTEAGVPYVLGGAMEVAAWLGMEAA